MYLTLVYIICGAVICCSSVPLFRRSENSVHLYDGLFLFSVATKRLLHMQSAVLLDLIVVRIESTTVNGLYNKLCRLFIKNTLVICVLKEKM